MVDISIDPVQLVLPIFSGAAGVLAGYQGFARAWLYLDRRVKLVETRFEGLDLRWADQYPLDLEKVTGFGSLLDSIAREVQFLPFAERHAYEILTRRIASNPFLYESRNYSSNELLQSQNDGYVQTYLGSLRSRFLDDKSRSRIDDDLERFKRYVTRAAQRRFGHGVLNALTLSWLRVAWLTSGIGGSLSAVAGQESRLDEGRSTMTQADDGASLVVNSHRRRDRLA